MSIRSIVATTVLVLIAFAAPAAAQNYGLDARNVGMGAIGSTRNIADEHIAERRSYHRIGLPLGLFHVIQHRDVFFYDSDRPRDFDLFRGLEYARNPFHYTLKRDQSATGKNIVDDIIDRTLNRNLTVYRQFKPAAQYVVEGVGFPNWGMTIKNRKNKDTALTPDERDADGYQGFYIGAGPYLTATTDTRVDAKFSELLGNPAAPLVPNTSMPITHETHVQGAAALVLGYRLYLPHQSTGNEMTFDADPFEERREGMYVYANYGVLFGFQLFDVNSTIRFDTDQTGLLTRTPSAPVIGVDMVQAKRGRGRVLDVGMAATIDRWDFGVGINGIANRIDWTDFTVDRTELANFFDGSEMEEATAAPVAEPKRVTLPINVSTNLAYTTGRWSVAGEYSRRFDGNNIQNGFEYRTSRLDLRAGLRYARDRWHPAGGVGVNLSPRIGIDAAVFSTSTNVERIRTVAFAFSIRINRKPREANDSPIGSGVPPPVAP